MDGPDRGLMTEQEAARNKRGPGTPGTAGRGSGVGAGPGVSDRPADPLAPMAQLFRDLRAVPAGLSGREAARRLEVSGPNELARRGGRSWPGELAAQFTQPLAVLLAVAAVLAWASGTPRLAIAIAAVILLNAGFAFAQEMQAERAVEALAAFLPEHARVLRDGTRQEIQVRLLVPAMSCWSRKAKASARTPASCYAGTGPCTVRQSPGHTPPRQRRPSRRRTGPRPHSKT